jgi:hypothetical protein
LPIVNRCGTVSRLVQVFIAAALLAGCAAGANPKAGAARAPSSSPVAPSPSARRLAPASTPAAPTAPPKPSALLVAPAGAAAEPQTNAFPQTTSTAFASVTHDIWLAIVTGNPDYARPAFFPEKAYEQVKAIASPQSDWRDRLWYDFTLDLAAAHKLVKPGAALVEFEVPAQYAQWIPPGACDNSVGYWHVPGARVVYRQAGTVQSFGIASFISWRGDWYLIHLGALTRGGAYGIVDDPAPGAGVPGPPGGC